MQYDWLIVGAGYTGAVLAERLASQQNQKVLVIDRRDHIAGNAFDYVNDHGVLIHKYGPHIFHTNSKKVWDYLSDFTEWRYYEHTVLASIDGQLVPIPFNLNSIYQVFPPNYASSLEDALISEFGYGKKVPILELLKNDNKNLKDLANYIYEKVFLGYTTKQWGLKPDELDKSVTSRIPVFVSRDNRYFQDKYQAIPLDGYTHLIQNILDHPNIEVKLNMSLADALNSDISYNRMVYTGPIDAYFDFKYGKLPYRSLTFSYRNYDKDHSQPVAQVNYPNNYDFTRMTEFNHLTGQEIGKSTVAIEYPHQYEEGVNEPYYPIPKDDNHEVFKKYEKEAIELKEKVVFAGRLADYKYYNMDQVVARALSVYETIE